MNNKQFELRKQLDLLALEYQNAWTAAQTEKLETGKISTGTNRKLIKIEREIDRVSTAWDKATFKGYERKYHW